MGKTEKEKTKEKDKSKAKSSKSDKVPKILKAQAGGGKSKKKVVLFIEITYIYYLEMVKNQIQG
jgi:hypothetical protein